MTTYNQKPNRPTAYYRDQIFNPVVLIVDKVKPNGPDKLIDKVIFADPATIVYWFDGSKTVVKCQHGDIYDREKGLALCLAKRAFGNGNEFNKIMTPWLNEIDVSDPALIPTVLDDIKTWFGKS